MKNLDEMKQQAEFLKMIVGLMAETGNKSSKYMLKEEDLHDRLLHLAVTNISDENYEQLINLLEQFESMLDDVVKELGIKESRDKDEIL